ncbi:hypothetical protein AB0Q95_12055 [Streptomyces sp. NPDC059900]|uniref:hypothetical protein n=1 Tax=Streptomyces sp. NPDC059900 TaxID=3155816 RepID=UPI00341AFE71
MGSRRLAALAGVAACGAWYERHGFADVGEVGDLLNDDGVRRERVMAKSLVAV